jgi:hypothetical protein
MGYKSKASVKCRSRSRSRLSKRHKYWLIRLLSRIEEAFNSQQIKERTFRAKEPRSRGIQTKSPPKQTERSDNELDKGGFPQEPSCTEKEHETIAPPLQAGMPSVPPSPDLSSQNHSKLHTPTVPSPDQSKPVIPTQSFETYNRAPRTRTRTIIVLIIMSMILTVSSVFLSIVFGSYTNINKAKHSENRNNTPWTPLNSEVHHIFGIPNNRIFSKECGGSGDCLFKAMAKGLQEAGVRNDNGNIWTHEQLRSATANLSVNESNITEYLDVSCLLSSYSQ